MEKNITCFIACSEETNLNDIIKGLPECRTVKIPCADNTETYRYIAAESHTPYTLVCRTKQHVRLGSRALERMTDYLSVPSCGMVYADRYEETEGELRPHPVIDYQALSVPSCGMVYADRYEETEGELRPHPVIDYQAGSVRDDFDFGSLILYRTEALKQAVFEISTESDYAYSASYAVRLALSRRYSLTHIREYLYTETETDTRRSGEKQFDYVDPRNRSVQIEREAVFTRYLKKTGARLYPILEKNRCLSASDRTLHRLKRRRFPLRSFGYYPSPKPGTDH